MFFKNFQRGVSDMYRKGTELADKLYQKAPEAIQKVSNISRQVGNVLGTVGNIGNKLLSDSVVRDLANSNPTLKGIYNNANKATNLAMVGGSLGNQISNLTNKDSYNNGSHESNIRDAIQRGKRIVDTGNLMNYA
jgi:hypothetical protein